MAGEPEAEKPATEESATEEPVIEEPAVEEPAAAEEPAPEPEPENAAVPPFDETPVDTVVDDGPPAEIDPPAVEATSAPVEADLEEPERPKTADKAIGPDDAPEEPPHLGDSAVVVSPQQPLPESLEAIESSSAIEPGISDLERDFKPRPNRRDSSTQTDGPWRPVTPVKRDSTPSIVVPDADDTDFRGLSRARSTRSSKRSIQQAEEVLAAAIIIRAAADSLGETNTKIADVVKDLKQHENADAHRGTGDAAASTMRDALIANMDTGVVDDNKSAAAAAAAANADDKTTTRSSPHRTREHRSSHSSRASRPSTRDGAAAASHHHHRHSSHRHKHEREPEQDAPRTPPRTNTSDSRTPLRAHTGDSSHGSHRSSRRERTPQEQAEHDKRKEERRLAREKEKQREAAPKNDVPPPAAVESKGKEVEASERPHRRSSRRHSSSRKENSAHPDAPADTDPSRPPPANKKFFDMKHGQSVLESKFGEPLAAGETAPPKDKESSSFGAGLMRRRSSRAARRSLDHASGKLQKPRAEEGGKVSSKDKAAAGDDTDNTADGAGVSAPAPAVVHGASSKDNKARDEDNKARKSRMEKREKEEAKEKEDKKKASGIKGMFKRLFSS